MTGNNVLQDIVMYFIATYSNVLRLYTHLIVWVFKIYIKQICTIYL